MYTLTGKMTDSILDNAMLSLASIKVAVILMCALFSYISVLFFTVMFVLEPARQFERLPTNQTLTNIERVVSSPRENSECEHALVQS